MSLCVITNPTLKYCYFFFKLPVVLLVNHRKKENIVFYIYLLIYHFWCFSFLPQVPGFHLWFSLWLEGQHLAFLVVQSAGDGFFQLLFT